MTSTMVPQAPPTGAFLRPGIIGGFQSPTAFLAAAQSANSALGPVTTRVTETFGGVLPGPIASAMMGGDDQLSDQSSDRQMHPIPVPIRMRAYRFKDYHKTVTKGTQMFSSLVAHTGNEDLQTMASVPVLNIMHQERAYADARVFAGQAPEAPGTEVAVLRALTATTPMEFSEMWGYVGPAVEPSQSNAFASEQQWGFAAPGTGRVEMANIFGCNVKLSDEVGFIVKLEEPAVEMADNPHAPQPRNILRIRGYAGRCMPNRQTSKTTVPAPHDVDCIKRDVRLEMQWRETKYDHSAPAGSKFSSVDNFAGDGLGSYVKSTLNVDLYEHGFYVRVGIVTDTFPKNAAAELVANAHLNILAFQKLPMIGVAPLVRRH